MKPADVPIADITEKLDEYAERLASFLKFHMQYFPRYPNEDDKMTSIRAEKYSDDLVWRFYMGELMIARREKDTMGIYAILFVSEGIGLTDGIQ